MDAPFPNASSPVYERLFNTSFLVVRISCVACHWDFVFRIL